MRTRPWLAAVVAATAAAALLPGPAQATPDRPAAPQAKRSAPAPLRPADVGGRTVTLVTGQRLHLTGAAGRERIVAVRNAKATGSLAIRRVPGHTYVFPTSVERFLGRSLDPALFDVTAPAADASHRTAVRVTYRGARPSIPGLHLTSARKGVARGYVTGRSAARFGRSLQHLRAGVVRVAGAARTAPVVIPNFPMFTLVIKVIGPDGKAQTDGDLALVNVDDGAKYASQFVPVVDGEARVSVPTGTYGGLSTNYAPGPNDTETDSLVNIDDYAVTGPSQVLTIDHRRATGTSSAVTPRPSTVVDQLVEWDRVDAAENFFATGLLLDEGSTVRLAPSAPARVGSLSVLRNWDLAERGPATPTYVYSLTATTDRMPAEPTVTFRSEDLATVRATYVGDGFGARGGYARTPLTDYGTGFGLLLPVARGAQRTEYAGAKGLGSYDVVWSDLASANINAEDPGVFAAPVRPLPTRSTTSQVWFRGPLGAGIPVQGDGGLCFGCRDGNLVAIGVQPVLDSDPNHAGDLDVAGDELPVARFRLYRGSTLLSDEDDSVGVVLRVRAKKATYHAVVDIDRRQTRPGLSTQSRTELGFSSARGKGQKVGDEVFCPAGDHCRALPLLQARVTLATDLQGRIPVGRSSVTVRVAQTEYAKTSPVTAATLEYRPQDQDWVTVRLRRASEGVYTGVIDTRASEMDPGSVADLRVSAADRAKSSYRQTVVRAFGVAR